jgi:hypothetical protein
MQWTNEFGRVIEWNEGEPWPTETPEETRLREIQYQIRESGGYYCRDGDHYTWAQFASLGCCVYCQAAIEHYYDSQIR